MRADLAAPDGVHHALEQRAEDGGRDARPLERSGFQQLAAHGGVEVGERNPLGEQLAIHIRKGSEVFVEIRLAAVFGRVEYVKDAGELGASVGAIGGGAVGEEELESREKAMARWRISFQEGMGGGLTVGIAEGSDLCQPDFRDPDHL